MVKYLPLPQLKDGCVYNCCDVVSGRLFVFGGCDMKGKAQSVSQCLDLSDRKEFIKLKEMPRIKAGASITHIDQKIITIGGIYDKQCQLDNVDAYDTDADSWTVLESLPNPTQAASVLSRENTIYCAGGLSIGLTSLKSLRMMDIREGHWQQLQDSLTSHSHAGAFFYNDCIYIIGGRNGKSFSQYCNCYDMRADAWRALPTVPTEYRNIFNSCIHLNGSVYLVGGLNEDAKRGFSDAVYRFDLKSERWEKLPNMLKPRADFGLFGDGERLVVAGGMGTLQGLSATVETFNFESKRWSLIDDMPTVHASSSKCVNEASMFLVSGMSHLGPIKDVTELIL